MVAPPSLQRLTVAVAVDTYTATFPRSVVMGSLSQVTVDNYVRDLTEFVEIVGGDRILDDLSGEDLDDAVVTYGSKPDGRFNDPGDRTRSLGAAARFMQSVSRLFSHATRVGWVQLNPVPDMLVTFKGSRTRAKSRTALPQSGAVALLSTTDSTGEKVVRADQDMKLRDRFILHLLMEVGPRVSELCKADRADISIDDDGAAWFDIRHGKGGGHRKVPLSPRTMEAFAHYDRDRPAPAPRTRKINGVLVETVGVDDAKRALILTWRGLRMKPRDVELMVHRQAAQMPAALMREVTPHGLRHTAATLLLASGAADVMTVRDILGHASVATTSVYLDSQADHMVAAVKLHPVTMPKGC